MVFFSLLLLLLYLLYIDLVGYFTCHIFSVSLFFLFVFKTKRTILFLPTLANERKTTSEESDELLEMWAKVFVGELRRHLVESSVGKYRLHLFSTTSSSSLLFSNIRLLCSLLFRENENFATEWQNWNCWRNALSTFRRGSTSINSNEEEEKKETNSFFVTSHFSRRFDRQILSCSLVG